MVHLPVPGTRREQLEQLGGGAAFAIPDPARLVAEANMVHLPVPGTRGEWLKQLVDGAVFAIPHLRRLGRTRREAGCTSTLVASGRRRRDG